MSLTEDEASNLVGLLKKCEPGKLPSNVFEAVAKVAVYPAIEFVLLRHTVEGIETLLFQRSPDDPVWPSLFHTPGTVLRPTDKSLEDAISRLSSDELGGVALSEKHFTGVHFNKYLRGNSIGIEYWLEVSGIPPKGRFYNINDLPQDFIAEQKDLLARAARAFSQAVNQ